MKIFTEKAFENRLAQERERMERDRWIQEKLRHLQKQIDELRWNYEMKSATTACCTKVNTDV